MATTDVSHGTPAESFLPPDFFIATSNDFSGSSVVISEKVGATLNLCPGVTGLSFLTAICQLFLNVES
jgi:hypothetical protein